ncbi:GD17301 [Drosophila simulans]|uniref:GD17301 n=1 Tax=Drosophila simulans TaxID=7240 RepID=B4R622_DROSI|nr:GD17301 [Drosophila simulans]
MAAQRDLPFVRPVREPLSLEDSPYKKKLVDVHRHPKERQKQQQKLRPVDEGFKELKELHGPDGQERYHNVRNALEHRSDPHPLSERQEQAMLEREQLERDKQLVINCREKRRLKEQIGEQPPPQDSNQSKNPTKESNKSTDPWKQVLQDRDRFQANCNRSCFYNNSQSSAPWKIYAKVASKLSSQLIASVDVEFHRSVINYINDIVGHKVK